MQYDIDTIKANLSITDLFTRDAHKPRRIGSSLVVLCPFHNEKTPSCHIHEKKSYFHCYGCGESGDTIAYWQKTRGVDFQTTLKDLASIAGVHGTEYTPTAAPTRKHLRKRFSEKETFPSPLTGTPLKQWLSAVQTLKASPTNQQKLASWRGYTHSIITWAVEQGILGITEYYGHPRQALLVERPEPPLKLDLENLPDTTDQETNTDHPQITQTLIPVSSHIRLAPHTEGNPHKKQSWRFQPKGCGSWPLIIGDYQNATVLLITEGQWDALALVDLMGWHLEPSETSQETGNCKLATSFPSDTAIIAPRGAQSLGLFIRHYTLNPDAKAFLFLDADTAGSTWLFKPCSTACPRHPKTTATESEFKSDICSKCDQRPPSFTELLNQRIHSTYPLQPSTQGKDLNDLIRERKITRPQLLHYLASKLSSPLQTQTTKKSLTLLQWAKQKHPSTESELETGNCQLETLNIILNDKHRPKGRKPLLHWTIHWQKNPHLTPQQQQALIDTFKLYLTETRTSLTPPILNNYPPTY